MLIGLKCRNSIIKKNLNEIIKLIYYDNILISEERYKDAYQVKN